MTTPSVRDLVAGHPFAVGLSPEQVAAVAQGAEIVDLAPGTVLVREGHPAEHAYLVLSGQVGIDVHVPGRGAVTVSTVGGGELLGWSWLLAPHVWHFDATARTPVRLVALDAETVRAACDRDLALDRSVNHRVIRTMTARLEAARHQLLDLYGHGGR